MLVVVLVACADDNGNGPILAVCDSDGEHKNWTDNNKNEEFKRYLKIDGQFGLPLSTMSKAAPLKMTENLFARSIKVNREDPNGAWYQKYNYVVCEEDDVETIWVAEWNVGTIRSVSQCKEPKFEVVGRKGKMINFFPEEADTKDFPEEARDKDDNLTRPKSPCLLKSLDSQLNTGLLDAISKHYMLAQGKGKSIEDLDADEWKNTRVRFAGEIIVDVDECEYWLNNNSGTYQPRRLNGSDQNESKQDELALSDLLKIADLFGKKLLVSPTRVIDVEFVSSNVNKIHSSSIEAPMGQLDCGNPQ